MNAGGSGHSWLERIPLKLAADAFAPAARAGRPFDRLSRLSRQPAKLALSKRSAPKGCRRYGSNCLITVILL